jgi:sec-independent protein translocase protein TatC
MKFKYALVVICITAAVITPTGDAFNMMMLALPMAALYEVSIWVVFVSQRRRTNNAAEII